MSTSTVEKPSTPSTKSKTKTDKTEEKSKSGSRWALGIILLVIVAACTYIFWPSASNGNKEEDLQAQIQKLQKQLEEKSLPDPIDLEKEKETAKTKDSIPEGRRVSLTNVSHQQTGPVVRSLGRLLKGSQGEKVYLLMGGPGGSKVLMYPSERSLSEVEQHLVFDGFRPPSGELVVVDTQPDPSGRLMNVYGWRLK